MQINVAESVPRLLLAVNLGTARDRHATVVPRGLICIILPWTNSLEIGRSLGG